MTYITVEEMRRWMNIPFTDDDLTIAEMIEGAEDAVIRHLNRDSYAELVDTSTNDIPSGLKTAIRTMVANLYQNRESIAYGQPYKVPYTYEYLLQPYKKYTRE